MSGIVTFLDLSLFQSGGGGDPTKFAVQLLPLWNGTIPADSVNLGFGVVGPSGESWTATTYLDDTVLSATTDSTNQVVVVTIPENQTDYTRTVRIVAENAYGSSELSYTQKIHTVVDIYYTIADTSSPVKIYDNYSGSLTYTLDDDTTEYTATTQSFETTGEHIAHFIFTSNALPARAFSGATEVTGAFLKGIEELKANAFRATSISALTANTLSIIGTSAFESCPNVTWSIIPTGITSIGQKAFNASGLGGALTIPASVTSLGSSAFTGTKIQSLDFAERDTILSLNGSQATFANTKNLTGVTINPNVNACSVNAFRGCTGLSVFTWTAMSESIGHAVDERSIRGNEFTDCKSLVTITLPEGIEKLAAGAFQGCTNLVSVILPASLYNDVYNTNIGLSSFSGSNVTAITCYAETAPNIHADAFVGMPASGTLYTPADADYSTWLAALGEGWTQETIPA